MFRLNPLTFVVCGAVLVLVIWVGFWFMRIQPTGKEIGYWREHNQKLDSIISEPSKKAAAERVRQALEKVHEAQGEWKLIAQTRTPSSGRMNLTDHRWQLAVHARRWHGQVETDLKKWIARSGVRVVAPVQAGKPGPFVPYPTDMPNELVEFYFNYPALPFPVAIWDLGAITVEGTYNQIVQHVRSWSRIPGYVASVRGLSIAGTGSRLQGTYNLLVLAYINTEYVFGGPSELQGKVPDMASAAAQAGGAPGQQGGTIARPGGGGAVGGGALVPGGGGAAAGSD